MKHFAWAAAATLTMLLGCASPKRVDSPNIADADAGRPRKPPSVAVLFRRFSDSGSNRVAEFELKNTGSQPVWFHGYLDEIPRKDRHRTIIHWTEYRAADRWADSGLGWCGTGAGRIRLGGGETVVFDVLVPQPDWAKTMRVGIMIWDSALENPWIPIRTKRATESPAKPMTLWSEAVPPL